MSLVGSKVGQPTSGVSLTDLTPPEFFFKILCDLERKARECDVLDFLQGTRTPLTVSQHTSEDIFFKRILERQTADDIRDYKTKLKELSVNSPLFVESLRVINNPFDQNPSPHGTRRSSQEVAIWRSERVVVSKAAVIQHVFWQTNTHIDGPDDPAAQLAVAEIVPSCFISVYTPNLTPEEQLRVSAARPPQPLQIDHLQQREAELNLDILCYEVTDDLAAIKAKIRDLAQAEKSYQDSLSRHNSNLEMTTKVNGTIEKFVNDFMPVAHSLCENLVVEKKWAEMYKRICDHFLELCTSHLDTSTGEKGKFPPFDPSKENIQAFKKRFSHYLANLQCLSQQAHVEYRTKTKIDFTTATTDVLLSDSAWSTKYTQPRGAVKETKDATARALLQGAIKDDSVYLNRFIIELRLKSDATPAELFASLLNEEILQKRTGVSSTSAAALSVNAIVQPVQTGGQKACQLHGSGHADNECKLQSSGKVVYNSTTNSWTYADTGDPFKRKAPSSEKKSSEPAEKKQKHELKPQGKGSKKDKEKTVPKDKEKKKAKDKEKKYVKKINGAIDGLKSTMINMVQNHTSSSSAASAAPAPAAPTASTQEANIVAALNVEFTELKKKLGLDP